MIKYNISDIGDFLDACRVLMKKDVFEDRTGQGIASRQCDTEPCVIMEVPQRNISYIFMNALDNML